MIDWFFNDSPPEDRLWELIRTLFPDTVAIWRRDFLVIRNRVLRRIDYIFYHIDFGFFVVELRTYYPDEILELGANGWIIRERREPDQFEDEGLVSPEPEPDFGDVTIVPNPYLQAETLAGALMEMMQGVISTVPKANVVVCLPNISRQEWNFDREQPPLHLRAFTLFQDDLNPHSFRGWLESTSIDKDKSRPSGARQGTSSQFEILTSLRAFFRNYSPFREQEPRRGREGREDEARLLSEMYSSVNKTLIFISYRRADSQWAAGRLYGRLHSVYEGIIFWDMDSIQPGADWQDAIETALDECVVLLAIIGPSWLTLTSSSGGRRRIALPSDWVSQEIKRAIDRKVPIIPILLDGTPMPMPSQLPPRIRALARFQALKMSADDFFVKSNVLIDRINDLLRIANP